MARSERLGWLLLSGRASRWRRGAALASLLGSLAACDEGAGGGAGSLQGFQIAGAAGAAGAANAAGAAGTAAGAAGKGAAGQAPAGAAGAANAAGKGGTAGKGELCDAYIACAGAVDPAGLAIVLAAYGKNGNCWEQGDPLLCEKACMAGVVQLHKGHPGEALCDRCDGDADCPAAAPACDEASRRCKECGSDEQCKTQSKPACDGASFACVECTSSAHCANQGLLCDAGAHQCVQCLSNADCGNLFNPGSVCDGGKCRGCASDTECAGGKCDPDGRCVQCLADADCGAGGRCLPQGFCGGCASDADCSEGVCNTILGVCCGQSACAQQGVVCGAALDFSCSLLPIPCAVCPGDQHCHENSCKPPPEDTCGPGHKCPGQCAYDPKANSYFCTDLTVTCPISVDGKVDPGSCGPGFVCETYTYNGSKYSECNRYCLGDADCGGTPGACKSLVEKSVGVCRFD